MWTIGPILGLPVSYQFDIGSHFCDLTHLYHDKLVNLWVFLFVIAHIVESESEFCVDNPNLM